MNLCQFNGDKNSFDELNDYIELFNNKGLINKNSDSITKLALLVHSDTSKSIPGIDIDCVSRSVNGYITYLKNLGDTDKSIRHFFELKQNINITNNDSIDIIDPYIFSNPFKAASYIKFIVVNEINNMFGLDYYNPNLNMNIDNKFLKCNDDFLSKYSDINEGIDQYYFYLIRAYTAYFEYYALYDYLLCYAYHLEEFGKSLIENNKQIAGKIKKTKYRKYKTKKSRNKKNKNKKIVSKKHKKLKKFTKKVKFGGVGGVKEALVEQNSLLAFAKRSPFWASIGVGSFTAAGVSLIGTACSISAPLVYDACTQVATQFAQESLCSLPGFTIPNAIMAGILTGSAASASLLAGLSLTSSSISTPYAKSGVIFEREPTELKSVPNVPKDYTPESERTKLETEILSDIPGLNAKITNLQKDLTKFNLYMIDDKFITSNSVQKFRVIFKEYIVLKLKQVFDANVDEMIELYKRKLLAEKISTISSTTTSSGDTITREKIMSDLQENSGRLKLTEEELTAINTSVRSKIAGLIIARAEDIVEQEVHRGSQGSETYSKLSSTDKIQLPGPNNSISILKQTENDVKSHVLTLVSSLIHIESANNFVFSPKVTANFVNMNWLYIMFWSLFSKIKENTKNMKDWFYIALQIIIFFSLLTTILGDFGFDPLNSEEILKDNKPSDEDMKKADEIYAKLRGEPATAPAPSSESNTNSEPSVVDKAIQFEQAFRQVEKAKREALDEYEKAKKACSSSFSGCMMDSNNWQTWVGTFLPSFQMNIYQARLHPSVVGITTTPFYGYAKIGLLRLCAFGSFVGSNWKSVGGLIGIAYAYSNILNTYSKFSSEVKGSVVDLDEQITEFKFDINRVLTEVRDDIDRGGGTKMKEAISQIQRTIANMSETNKDIQAAIQQFLNQSKFQLTILQDIREEERLRLEQEQVNIAKQNVNIAERGLALQERGVVAQEQKVDIIIKDGEERRLENIQRSEQEAQHTLLLLSGLPPVTSVASVAQTQSAISPSVASVAQTQSSISPSVAEPDNDLMELERRLRDLDAPVVKSSEAFQTFEDFQRRLTDLGISSISSSNLLTQKQSKVAVSS